MSPSGDIFRPAELIQPLYVDLQRFELRINHREALSTGGASHKSQAPRGDMVVILSLNKAIHFGLCRFMCHLVRNVWAVPSGTQREKRPWATRVAR